MSRGESLFPNAVAIPLRGRFRGGVGRRGTRKHQTPGQARSQSGKRFRKEQRRAAFMANPESHIQAFRALAAAAIANRWAWTPGTREWVERQRHEQAAKALRQRQLEMARLKPRRPQWWEED